jgi:FAD/FMN-containing dehydrogenase
MAIESPSWGRYPSAQQDVLAITSRSGALPDFPGHALPRGNGRSYGDSCLDDGGTLLDARLLDRFIELDTHRGVLRCEGGVLLSDILHIVVPRGWFLPVTPGTKFITVGGAIANDVHGKNHHVAGTFSNHVRVLELLRSNGERLRCGPFENADWFAATAGGLGLTGLITWAEVQLKRIDGPMMAAETCRFDDLDEFFRLSDESEHEYEYTVAWVDCTARGRSLGRGVFSRANHSAADSPSGWHQYPTRGMRVPFTPPFSLVNPFSVRCFNNLYFHRQPRTTRYSLEHYEPWFYPLDSLRECTAPMASCNINASFLRIPRMPP